MDPIQQNRAVALVETNSAPLGVQLVSSRRTNKPSDAMDLVELARTVQKADEFTKANAGNKLTVIADQIRYLQEQAKKVLEDARRDTMLHHSACNIVKRPGTMYYLYERESGQGYLSILSPEEWGASCPHEFLGAFRLEYDQSWTPINLVENRDRENAVIDKIFHAQQAITSGSSTADILGFNLKKIDSSSRIEDMSEQNVDASHTSPSSGV